MIYKKIINIMNELIPIGKIKREEITSIMQPLLAKYKLVIRPSEVSNYKYISQEASFEMLYEVIDAENNDNSKLESILLKVPAGGYDQENKGRATYMASTGAYRQALQQLFSIQIFDELSQGSNSEFNFSSNAPGEYPHEFEQSTPSVQQVQNERTQNTNGQNIQNNQTRTSNEITDNYIESEFAGFFEEDVA